MHAPFGGVGKYERSLHVAGIVWVQRVMAWWRPWQNWVLLSYSFRLYGWLFLFHIGVLIAGPWLAFQFAQIAYFCRQLKVDDREQEPAAQHLRCENCGYDLTGNESGVCPECGTPIPRQ